MVLNLKVLRVYLCFLIIPQFQNSSPDTDLTARLERGQAIMNTNQAAPSTASNLAEAMPGTWVLDFTHIFHIICINYCFFNL